MRTVLAGCSLVQLLPEFLGPRPHVHVLFHSSLSRKERESKEEVLVVGTLSDPVPDVPIRHHADTGTSMHAEPPSHTVDGSVIIVQPPS
jgi:hypothetical protein